MNNNTTNTDPDLVALIEYKVPTWATPYSLRPTGYRLDTWSVFAGKDGRVTAVTVTGAKKEYANVEKVVAEIKRAGFEVMSVITADSFAAA